MTYKQYLNCIAKAQTCDDSEKSFQIIKAVAENNFPKLMKITNLTAYQLDKLYGINVRTAQRWASGERIPPSYLMQLIGYALISELPETEQE